MEKVLSSLVDKYPRVSDMVGVAKRRMPHFAAEYLQPYTKKQVLK